MYMNTQRKRGGREVEREGRVTERERERGLYVLTWKNVYIHAAMQKISVKNKNKNMEYMHLYILNEEYRKCFWGVRKD